MSDLTINEQHVYRSDGVIVPGVTTILRDVGLIDDRFMAPIALDRGAKVHRMLHYYDENDLDENVIDERLRPYLAAWKKFRHETGFIPTKIEEKFYSRAHGFAGTIDRWGQLNGIDAILEIKSGAPLAFHRIQAAGYSILLRDNAVMCRGRAVVYLSDDGNYKIKYCRGMQDESIFLACLTVYNAKRNGK